MPTALITRPAEDSGPVAAALRERGIEAVIAPMLIVEAVPETEANTASDLIDAQAVLLTSRNGARALARATAERGITILAVGDATAAAARELGFRNVESAAGDSRALAALAAARLDPKAGALVHVSGEDVAGDLAGPLEAAGFALRRAVLYRTRRAGELPPDAVRALSSGALDCVLFFSPRTAETFVMLVREAGLESACAEMTGICLSPAVAAKAEGMPWKKLVAASRPDMASMVAAVENAVENAVDQAPDNP